MEKQAPEVDHEELSVQPAFGEKDFEPQTQQDAASDFERDEELRPAVPNTRVGTRTGTEERPSRWRRLLVIIGMLVVFWLISSIRSAQKAPPKIVHASRYVQLLGYLDTNKLSLLSFVQKIFKRIQIPTSGEPNYHGAAERRANTHPGCRTDFPCRRTSGIAYGSSDRESESKWQREGKREGEDENCASKKVIGTRLNA